MRHNPPIKKRAMARTKPCTGPTKTHKKRTGPIRRVVEQKVVVRTPGTLSAPAQAFVDQRLKRGVFDNEAVWGLGAVHAAVMKNDLLGLEAALIRAKVTGIDCHDGLPPKYMMSMMDADCTVEAAEVIWKHLGHVNENDIMNMGHCAMRGRNLDMVLYFAGKSAAVARYLWHLLNDEVEDTIKAMHDDTLGLEWGEDVEGASEMDKAKDKGFREGVRWEIIRTKLDFLVVARARVDLAFPYARS